MKRQVLVCVAAIGMSAAVANAQGTPVSYYVDNVSTTWITVVDPVPAGGFILTDIVGGSIADRTLFVGEDTGAGPVNRLSTARTNVTNIGALELHLQTGILFAAGSRMTAISNPGSAAYTFIGYIPSTSVFESIPAIGSWGLAAMVLLLLTGGTVIMRRPRVA